MSAFANFHDISDDSEDDDKMTTKAAPIASQSAIGSNLKESFSNYYKSSQKSKLAKEREAAEERVRERRIAGENSRRAREEEKQAKLALLQEEKKRKNVQEELNALEHAYPNPQILLDSEEVFEKELILRAALKQEFIDVVSNAEDIILMSSVVEELQGSR